MDNYFYHRFRNKKSEDLESILENSSGYDAKAVSAAEFILQQRRTKEVTRENETLNNLEKPQKNFFLDEFANSLDFSGDSYFRTLSKREIFTAIMLSFLSLALYEIIMFYQDEAWLKGISFEFFLICFGVMYIFNHVIYKIEHKRRNVFTGRFLQGLLFVYLFILFFWLNSSLTNSFWVIGLGDAIVTLIALSLSIFFLEIIISFINRFFRVLKWHLW